MKKTLTNTTVRYIKGLNQFSVSKGKGTGRQIACFSTMDTAMNFDKEFKNLERKPIVQKSTGDSGSAYFYVGTYKMFDINHPFYNDFLIS